MARSKAVVNKDELKIEYVPLDQVQKWPRNPKNHDLDALGKSIGRFGFVQPVIVDGKTKRLVAGHGRLEALLRMKEVGEKPPARIQVDKKTGAWLVPVLSGIRFLSESDAEAYLVADNRLVEVGGWDERMLTEILKDISANSKGLEGVGYTEEDLQSLLSFVATVNYDPVAIGNFEGYEPPLRALRVIVTCDSKEEIQKVFSLLGVEYKENRTTLLFSELKNAS